MNTKSINIVAAAILAMEATFPLVAVSAERNEEVLMGVNITDREIELHVASGGCTNRNSFSIEIDKEGAGKLPYVLRVYRVKPDDCEAFLPGGVIVSFSKDELGLSEIFEMSLTNKLGITSLHR